MCSGLLTRRPGPPPPSRPPARSPSESGRAVAFRAARLPPDLGAGEWGPRAAREEWGELFLVPFPSSPPPAGRCLFLETLSFGRSGSPGSRSNSRPPPSELPPPRPPAPGRLARGRPRSPLAAWRSQLAPGGQARPGPGVGGGPAPARKLESFVLAPRPGRRGGGGEGAEVAPGRPRAGWGLALASLGDPGFFRLSSPGQLFGFP